MDISLCGTPDCPLGKKNKEAVDPLVQAVGKFLLKNPKPHECFVDRYKEMRDAYEAYKKSEGA